MESKHTSQQTREARLAELDRQMHQIDEKAAHLSKEAGDHLRSRVSALRIRLDSAHAEMRAKEEADDRAQDAALAEVGHAIDEMYAELMAWPR